MFAKYWNEPGTLSHRAIGSLLALIVAALPAASAIAQTWPNRTIQLVVPFPNVGGPDLMGRLIAEHLRQGLGQSVVVDNRPGGGSNIGTEFVARSPADGYTLLLAVSPPFTTVGALYPKPPYDPVKSFAPASLVAAVEMTLIVHNSVPVNTVSEFVAYARANPGLMDYGTGGNGSPHHLAMEMLKELAKIDLVHVPYRGASLALRDVAGGRLKAMFQSYGTSRPFITSGHVRPIAVTGQKRVPQAPSLPLFSESGYPGLDVTTWYGVMAPAGTPEAVVRRLNGEIVKLVAKPEVQEKLHSLDLEPIAGPVEDFERRIAADIRKWGEVIRARNIRAD